eukprot:IDg21004t1
MFSRSFLWRSNCCCMLRNCIRCCMVLRGRLCSVEVMEKMLLALASSSSESELSNGVCGAHIKKSCGDEDPSRGTAMYQNCFLASWNPAGS